MTVPNALSTLLALALGGVFLASAIAKVCAPRSFVLAVLEYRALPPPLGRLYGWLLPPTELVVALLLLTGTVLSATALVALLLLASFLIGVGWNIARGHDLDCHCFGPTSRRRIGWRLVAEDVALLLAAACLIVLASPRGWTQLAVLSPFWLFGPRGGVSFAVGSCVVAAGVIVVWLHWYTTAAQRASLVTFAQAILRWVLRYQQVPRSARAAAPQATPLPALVRAARPAAAARDGSPAAAQARARPGVPEQMVPALVVATANGFGTVDLRVLAAGSDGVLVVCVSPLCPGCQALVGPLNALAASTFGGRIVILVGADEPSCRSFVRVFPIRWPVVCDPGHAMAHALGVERTPTGLLFDSHGVLVRRELIASPADLDALLA